MIDLHTHALPQIDDGAKTVQESIEMLSDSFLQGVRICALTPHCVVRANEDIDNFIEKRQNSYTQLKTALNSTEVPKLFLGAEVYVDHDISTYDDIEELCIGDSKKMLIELPIDKRYKWLADCIFSLNLKGITVVLAHIDRYMAREDIIRDLIGLDVIYQINATRFLSFSGRRIIKKLLLNDAKFIISSDMHNMAKRRCYMKAAYEKAMKMFPGQADLMFNNNIETII